MCKCPKSSGAEECVYFSQNFFSVAHRHVRYQITLVLCFERKIKTHSFIYVWCFFSYYLLGELFLFILFCFLGAWKPDLNIRHKIMLVLLSMLPGTFSSHPRALALCDVLCTNTIV